MEMNFDLGIWRNTGPKILVIQMYIKLPQQCLEEAGALYALWEEVLNMQSQ